MKHKRIFVALVAVAAFGATAAIASAAINITHPTGTVLAVGSELTMTNVGEAKFTSTGGNVSCYLATPTGTVVSNTTAGGFKVEVTSAPFSGTNTTADCTAFGSFIDGAVKVTTNPTPNGLPWCIKSAANDNFEITGGSCAGAARAIRIVLDVTFKATCVYEKSGPITGTATTDTAGADGMLTITPAEFKLVSGAGCPAAVTMDLATTVEKDGGLSEPVWFSS